MTGDGPRRASSFATRPYPGEIPPGPFCIERGVVRSLTLDGSTYYLTDGATLGHWLSDSNTGMVSLLAYGSNACPGRLAQKLGDDLDGVVVLPATLHGAARVWAAEVNSQGVVPMTLAGDADGAEAVHLLLLPDRYATPLDHSEGRRGPFYLLARLDDCIVRTPGLPAWPQPLTYLGHARRGPLMLDGRPARLDAIDQQNVLDVLNRRGSGPADDSALPAHTPVPTSVTLPGAHLPTDPDPASWT